MAKDRIIAENTPISTELIEYREAASWDHNRPTVRTGSQLATSGTRTGRAPPRQESNSPGTVIYDGGYNDPNYGLY